MPRKANAADLGKLPTLPRFTLDSLRAITIPPPADGESTLTRYTYTHNKKRIFKYARLEDLTRAEREAALQFILQYGAGEIRRKGKPRGRSAQPRNAGDQGSPATGATRRRLPEEIDGFNTDELEKLDFDTDPLESLDFDIQIPDPADLGGDQGEKVLPNPKRRKPRRKQ